MARKSWRTDDLEPWWETSPWDLVIALTCLAVQLVIAVTCFDLTEWPPRIALAALTAYCFWLLEKAIKNRLEPRQASPIGETDDPD